MNWLNIAWPRIAGGPRVCGYAPDPVRTPIMQALALAAAAGIPIEDTRGVALTIGRTPPQPDDVEAWLVEVLTADPKWLALAEVEPQPFQLQPVAIAHLIGQGAVPQQHLFPFRPGYGPRSVAGLAAALRDVVVECLTSLSNTDEDAVFELVVRPAPSAWLHLGAAVFPVRFRPDRASEGCRASLTPEGRLTFVETVSPGVHELAPQIRGLWPIEFDALLVERDGEVRLADLSISGQSEEANTCRLADSLQASQGQAPISSSLLANSSPKARAPRAGATHLLCRGQPHGDRWATGPLVTSLESAMSLAAAGQKPVLLLEKLLPSQASLLDSLAGLGLREDGPASHITILARTIGLAVVTRLDYQRLDGNRLQTTGGLLDEREMVTLSEADGALYRGAAALGLSPVQSIASALQLVGNNPVAITDTGRGRVAGPAATSVVGLCRSEMQVLATPAVVELTSYLHQSVGSMMRQSVPASLAAHLEEALANLLSVSGGALVNYRLLDADLGEVLATGITTPAVDSGRAARHGTLRGPRWALASGFYGWQIGMAFEVATRALMEGPVDLVLTLPSAFSLEEVRAVRRIYDRELIAHPQARGAVRFGIMIETPRLCATPTALTVLAEVFCFGLNDLTAAIFGLDRDAWGVLGDYYTLAGLQSDDPFASLDPVAVAPMVQRTIGALRRAGAEGPIFLCGEAATSRAAHALIARERDVWVSVARSDWASAMVSCGRERARLEGALGLEAGATAALTRAAAGQAAAAAHAGRPDLAAATALRWLSAVCPLSGTAGTQNWKVLKKRLVDALFGALEGRFFMPDWRSEEVLDYVSQQLPKQRVMRVSAFPAGISCHARSEAVDPCWDAAQLRAFIDSFDVEAVLHVFPQQNADQLCFRAVFTEGGAVVEAGWGQAMYVFEAERGRHPVVVARAPRDGGFTLCDTTGPERLVLGLRSLLSAQGTWLCTVGNVVTALLGLEQFAIEGYFDPQFPARVAVVDIDLPLDIAWNITC